MPDDVLYHDTLSIAETRLVQAMRRFLSETRPSSCSGSDPAIEHVVPHLHRFLDLLWHFDPFSVDLNHPFDPGTSAFEVQLLYAMASARAGDRKTVGELIGWWFPAELTARSEAALDAIARVLDEHDMPPQSCSRLRDHILAITSARLRSRYVFALSGSEMPKPANAARPATIH